jgi:hypothetical protein
VAGTCGKAGGEHPHLEHGSTLNSCASRAPSSENGVFKSSPEPGNRMVYHRCAGTALYSIELPYGAGTASAS